MYDDPSTLIREARQLLNAEPEETTRSAKTEADYERMAERLIGSTGSASEIIARAGKTNCAMQ